MMPIRSSRFIVEERRRLILERVGKQGRASINELAACFDVSQGTIRNDLEALAHAGVLSRTRGGAYSPNPSSFDARLDSKEAMRRIHKRRIGHAAAQLIEDGETLILDDSTTTLETASALRQRSWRHLTVITNGIKIALELSSSPGVRVVVLGGLMRQESLSTIDLDRTGTLSRLSADRLFIGAEGLDVQAGLTTLDSFDAAYSDMMMRAAKEVVALVDSSKFGIRSALVAVPLSSLRAVISDVGATEDHVRTLQNAGVRVTLV